MRKAALAAQACMAPDSAPLLLLSGGELTLTQRGNGDGRAEGARALVGPATLGKAHAMARDPAAALAQNNAHSLFAALGAQVITGPTLTNVNSFRAQSIQPVTAQPG